MHFVSAESSGEQMLIAWNAGIGLDKCLHLCQNELKRFKEETVTKIP